MSAHSALWETLARGTSKGAGHSEEATTTRGLDGPLDRFIGPQYPFSREPQPCRQPVRCFVLGVDYQEDTLNACGEPPVNEEAECSSSNASATLRGNNPVVRLGAHVSRIEVQSYLS